uniref:Uncharacterized protein n=1 Tax=Haptolina ericina TaxID=156174 RepID=A0A6T9F9X5_9EUKA
MHAWGGEGGEGGEDGEGGEGGEGGEDGEGREGREVEGWGGAEQVGNVYASRMELDKTHDVLHDHDDLDALRDAAQWSFCVRACMRASSLLLLCSYQSTVFFSLTFFVSTRHPRAKSARSISRHQQRRCQIDGNALSSVL